MRPAKPKAPVAQTIGWCPKCKARRFVNAGKCVQCGTKVEL